MSTGNFKFAISINDIFVISDPNVMQYENICDFYWLQRPRC